MFLTEEEIIFILDKISDGFGYSDDPKVANLQGKLSIMLEAKQRVRLAEEAHENSSKEKV